MLETRDLTDSRMTDTATEKIASRLEEAADAIETSLRRTRRALGSAAADMSDDTDAAGFLRADARGFLDEDPTDASVTEMRETMRAATAGTSKEPGTRITSTSAAPPAFNSARAFFTSASVYLVL